MYKIVSQSFKSIVRPAHMHQCAEYGAGLLEGRTAPRVTMCGFVGLLKRGAKKNRNKKANENLRSNGRGTLVTNAIQSGWGENKF